MSEWRRMYIVSSDELFTGRVSQNSFSLHEQDRLTGLRQFEDMKHQLPSKPLSVKEESMKRGYFPVSWRVIGGGVRIGGSSGERLTDRIISHTQQTDRLDEYFLGI